MVEAIWGRAPRSSPVGQVFYCNAFPNGGVIYFSEAMIPPSIYILTFHHDTTISVIKEPAEKLHFSKPEIPPT
jgi:hypothetical protein